jgi:hypothetical protein
MSENAVAAEATREDFERDDKVAQTVVTRLMPQLVGQPGVMALVSEWMLACCAVTCCGQDIALAERFIDMAGSDVKKRYHGMRNAIEQARQMHGLAAVPVQGNG